MHSEFLEDFPIITSRFILNASHRSELKRFIGGEFTLEQKSIQWELTSGVALAQEKEGCYVVTISANSPFEAVDFLVQAMVHFGHDRPVRVGRGAFQRAIDATYNLSR